MGFNQNVNFRNVFVPLGPLLVYFRKRRHLPHSLWECDVARIFLFYFSKRCNMFLTKVQQSYCYTKLCNYREEFVPKPISNIPNILVCCKFH